ALAGTTAYVAGWTDGLLPAASAMQSKQAGIDITVAAFDTTKSGAASLPFFTYLGGNDSDYGTGIDAGPNGRVYITGSTLSPDFSVTTGAPCTNIDAFAIRLNTAPAAIEMSTCLNGGLPFCHSDGFDIAVGPAGHTESTR